MQGSFYIFLTDLFRKVIFHQFVWDHFLDKWISSIFRRFYHFNYLCITLSCSLGFIAKSRNTFLCHDLCCFYLISLWMVILLKIGLYFFNSSLPGVFFLFLVVIYLDVPGRPLSLCSVHSKITCTLFPFAFFPIASSFNLLSIQVSFLGCLFKSGIQSYFVDKTQTCGWNIQADPAIFFYPIKFFSEQFTLNLRLVFLLEWEMRFPTIAFFPVIWQILAIFYCFLNRYRLVVTQIRAQN